MSDFRLEQVNQIKKIANFDLNAENKLKSISVFEFLLHLQAMHDDNEA